MWRFVGWSRRTGSPCNLKLLPVYFNTLFGQRAVLVRVVEGHPGGDGDPCERERVSDNNAANLGDDFAATSAGSRGDTKTKP